MIMSEQGLTVKELREKLAEYPDDMEVFVDGYEAGIAALLRRNVRKCGILKNANDDGYMGRHEEFQSWSKGEPDCEGIVLSR